MPTLKLRIHRSSWVTVSILIMCASFGTAQAHEDTLLTRDLGGAIGGLPKDYLPAQFLIDRDKKGRAIRASLRLTAGHYAFPECILRLFPRPPRSRISLTASWYHAGTLLPPYIELNFRNDDQAGLWLLFNLRTAELLEVTDPTRLAEGNIFERVCPGRKMTDGWQRMSARSAE
jgi:hypothetical protein